MDSCSNSSFSDLLLCQVFRVTAKRDIRSAPRHVGCYRNRALASRLCDYRRFFFMVLRVQNVMLDAFAFEKFAQYLGFFYRNRAYKHRLTLCVNFLDLFHNGFEFADFAFVDLVVEVFSYHRAVCRNFDNVKSVYLSELVLFRQRRTGHARKFFVKPEKILECYRGKRFGSRFLS